MDGWNVVCGRLGTEEDGKETRKDHEDDQDDLDPSEDVLDEDTSFEEAAVDNDNGCEQTSSQDFRLELR